MSETKEQDSLAQQAVEFLEQLLMTPANPDLPPDLAAVKGFEKLYGLVVDIKDVLFHFAKGEFGHKFRQPGSTPATSRPFRAISATWPGSATPWPTVI